MFRNLLAAAGALLVVGTVSAQTGDVVRLNITSANNGGATEFRTLGFDGDASIELTGRGGFHGGGFHGGHGGVLYGGVTFRGGVAYRGGIGYGGFYRPLYGAGYYRPFYHGSIIRPYYAGFRSYYNYPFVGLGLTYSSPYNYGYYNGGYPYYGGNGGYPYSGGYYTGGYYAPVTYDPCSCVNPTVAPYAAPSYYQQVPPAMPRAEPIPGNPQVVPPGGGKFRYDDPIGPGEPRPQPGTPLSNPKGGLPGVPLEGMPVGLPGANNSSFTFPAYGDPGTTLRTKK